MQLPFSLMDFNITEATCDFLPGKWSIAKPPFQIALAQSRSGLTSQLPGWISSYRALWQNAVWVIVEGCFHT